MGHNLSRKDFIKTGSVAVSGTADAKTAFSLLYSPGTNVPDHTEVIPRAPSRIDNSEKAAIGAAEFKIKVCPANSGARFRFSLPKKQKVTLSISDMLGRPVWKYSDIVKNEIVWSGEDLEGNKVPKGIYIYELKLGNRFDSGRVVITR